MNKEILAMQKIIANKDKIRNVTPGFNSGTEFFFEYGGVKCSILKNEFGSFYFYTYDTQMNIEQLANLPDFAEFRGITIFEWSDYTDVEKQVFIVLYKVVRELSKNSNGLLDKIINEE